MGKGLRLGILLWWGKGEKINKQKATAECDTCYDGLATKSYLTLATPWTEAHQAPLSMGFPRQEY